MTVKNTSRLKTNEDERVKALLSYEILDSAQEAEFDRLTELATIICGTPISTIALLDHTRQWFKSKKGLAADQTVRSISFCHYAIMEDRMLQVEDAQLDDRFKSNPLVTGEPNIRFYAGFPLIDPNGYALGALCVIDRQPRQLDEPQKKALSILADEVVSQIIARKERIDLANYEQLFNLTSDLVCITDAGGNIKTVNPATEAILGWEAEQNIVNELPRFLGSGHIALEKNESTDGFTSNLKSLSDENLVVDWVSIKDNLTGYNYGIGRNVTLQKQIEAELVRTRDLLEETSQVAKVGGWQINYETQYSWWSPITKDILEVPHDYEVLPGRGIQFFPEGEHRETIVRLLEEAKTQSNSFDEVLTIVTAKGNHRWVRVIGKPSFKDGHFIGIYGTFQDITEQKERENLISVSEKRFRQTFSHTAVGMFLVDPATSNFIEVNDALCTLTGYMRQELVGMHFKALTHPDDLPNVIGQLVKVLEGEASNITLRKRMITHNNTVIWVELIASLVRDEDGLPVNIIGQVLDVTEQLDAERRLKLSEEKHRGFFENSQGLMCTHDLSGRLLSVNPAGANLLGYEREEMLQKSLFDIVAADHTGLVADYLEKIEQRGSFKGLMRVMHRDGSERTWMYNNVLSEQLDGKKYVIGNAVDITERINMEIKLHKAKEIAIKNAQAKDVFLANMSHEIRTPMNAITGFANLLKDSVLDREQNRYVSYINTASENLLGIINDILDFSKIESGQITLECIPFNVKELIKNVKAVLSHKAAEKHLLLHYNIDSDIPDVLGGDPTRLNQILLNLANNAIKFTEFGAVEVRAQLESIENDECRLHLTVSDTGIGIPADKQHSIFNRFTQADSDTTRKYGGTGLGLSISKSLVEMQHGEIWVESQLHSGSTFHVILPFKIVEQTEIADRTPKHQRLWSDQQLRILLVEDNTLNQKLAMKVLENFNFIPDLAENGVAAIEKLKQTSYDIILMDLQMPEMDGYQATGIIRKELRISTPIIAMTAHSLVGERDKCISAGMNDYIPKPFVPYDVFNAILYHTAAQSSNRSEEKSALRSAQNIPIDLSYLRTLSGGITDFENEMIELFLKQTPLDMDELGRSVANGYFVGIRQMAHKLISSFALMGIKDEGILKLMEEQPNAEAEVLRERYQHLKKIFTNAVEFLQEEISYAGR